MGETVSTALLGVDWGTTSARAYRLGADGRVQEERSAPLGIQHVREGAFRHALDELLGDWRELSVPRLACGMIGSRQGWIEAPYRHCPVALPELAAAVVRTPGNELSIIAGISCRDEGGVPDVMRGEETQVLGLAVAGASGLVVHPGTHSKWTMLADAQGTPAIVAFNTYMTGETFAVLRDHSILGRLMRESPTLDEEAFARGVQRAFSADGAGDLLHQIFGARSSALLGELEQTSAADYLSGLLIGAEVAAGRQWAARHGASDDGLWLAGSPLLCARYERALALAGMNARIAPPDVATRGLWRVAVQAGLVHEGEQR